MGEASGPPEAEGSKAGNPAAVEVDKDVPALLKSAAAVVTILAALMGVAFTAYQLRLKSVEDRETAKLNHDAEDHKLTLGQAQIAQQDRIHTEDNKLELEKHKLDIQQAKDQASALEKKNERDSLATVINKMFSDPSSEGDIAALFEYIRRDASSREIVENALLARLENPKSREEVDLGFRVLEAIGPASIDSIVRANCSARKTYDATVLEDFARRLNQGATMADKRFAPELADAIRDQTELDVVGETSLNPFYVLATINDKYYRADAPALRAHYYETNSDLKTVTIKIGLSEAVIDRSNVAISQILHSMEPGTQGHIDFSTAYIRADVSEGKFEPSFVNRIRCNGCFIESSHDPELTNKNGSWLGSLSRSSMVGSDFERMAKETKVERYRLDFHP